MLICGHPKSCFGGGNFGAKEQTYGFAPSTLGNKNYIASGNAYIFNQKGCVILIEWL
jgi:hypothetical protein